MHVHLRVCRCRELHFINLLPLNQKVSSKQPFKCAQSTIYWCKRYITIGQSSYSICGHNSSYQYQGRRMMEVNFQSGTNAQMYIMLEI